MIADRLRPIGTEFTQTYPPFKCGVQSNDGGGRITWRVVAHVQCNRFPGDPVGELCEEIKAIKCEELPLPTFAKWELTDSD